MLSQRLTRLSQVQTRRLAGPFLANVRNFTERSQDPEHSDQRGDVLHQQFVAAKEIKKDPSKAAPLDAASLSKGQKASHDGLTGNPEGVGFVDQVGSQSASSNKRDRAATFEGLTGDENITPPSFTDALKSKLGFKTTAGEDKQNRGGGEGVTGTGIPRFDSGKRLFSTSAIARGDHTTTGEAPNASRQPKERTFGEQNSHLKHRSSSTGVNSGQGNAAPEPTLPSHHRKDKLSSTQSRTFSTSARRLQDEEHNAETYFKDVDDSPPTSAKTHQVDSGETGASIQRPHESLTGQYSRAGSQTNEYQTMDREHPYDVPPSDGDVKQQTLRYGTQPNMNKENIQEDVDNADEGPSGKDKGGRS
ncbi:hypothetical protein C8Q75DRAFT_795841 [Abortiporus biennis]|nr:hypothetical protein C8Q75DRAFT_795841 [Abortiporus biennis]